MPFLVPLPSKAAPGVLDGITEILTKIKAMGLCVRRVHSDRGREFVNTAMKRYCSHRGLIRTTTSADDFKMNGRCEAMVGRLKSATKTLLSASGIGADHWAFAMRHVVARAQSDLLRQLGVKQPVLPPFATRVFVKRRSWTARYQEWEEKVVPATILCPSVDVSRGFLVKTEDGSYLTKMAAVEHVKEITGEFEIPEEHAAPAGDPIPVPKVRLRGKQRVASAQEMAEEQEDEALAKKFLEAEDFSVQALENLVCQLRLRDQTRPLRPRTMTQATSEAAVHSFGVFRHGGVTGLTSSLKRRPLLVKFVNAVLQRALPKDASYTTFSINYDTPLAVHADYHNDHTTKNYVIGCGDYVGGDVWVALHPEEEAKFPVAWRQFNGRWLQGQIHPIYHQVAAFSPSRPHSPVAWNGIRVSVAAYTVGRHQAATGEARDHLLTAGFPVPPEVRAWHEGGDGGGKGLCSVQLSTAEHVSGGEGPLFSVRRQNKVVESCACKGYEVDPSLCVCREVGPQQFYIGDFALGSEGEGQPGDLPNSGGESLDHGLHGDSLRALRHPGSGGERPDPGLHGDSLRALRHPGSGGERPDPGLHGDSLRALRHPGSGGERPDPGLPGDSVRALRHPGSGGEHLDCGLFGDSVRALRHPGSGGEAASHLVQGSSSDSSQQSGCGAGDSEGAGFGGHLVDVSVRRLRAVGSGQPSDTEEVQWEMLVSEVMLGPCDRDGCEELERLRVYLLMIDNEEREALASEVDKGDELGTSGRLRRLTGQVTEIENVLEQVEMLFDDGGEHAGGWDRVASAKEGEGDAPLHTKTVTLEEVRRNLAKRVPSMISEYQSLMLDNSAVSPFSEQELEAWDRAGKEYDLSKLSLVD